MNRQPTYNHHEAAVHTPELSNPSESVEHVEILSPKATGTSKVTAANGLLSHFLDQMSISTMSTVNESSSRYSVASLPSHVDPATIPIRTSSTKALSTADTKRSSVHTPRREKSRILVPEERRRLPEVNEREWMAQSRNKKPSHLSSSSLEAPLRQEQRSSTTNMASETIHPISSDLIAGGVSRWTPEKENILKGPYDYLESQPGKDIRSQMIAAFNAWLQVPPESLAIITRVVAMLHTASLLVDDVEDNSNLRRGNPVAHSIFGTAQTINSANYVYFCALKELLTLNNPEAIQIYTDELLNLHRGQGMDLFWRDTLTCPTEDDYLEMVGNKTGGLFRLAVKLMCAESPTHKFSAAPDSFTATSSTLNSAPSADYVPLVNTIGLLFQILDDYRNLSDTTYTANKGLCEDLTEGKFSFPIIHAIRADPSSLVLINILKQKTTDDEVKKYAVSYMDRAGSFTYTRRVLRGLTKRAMSLVEEVDAGRGKGDGIKAILERLRVDKHSRGSQSQ